MVIAWGSLNAHAYVKPSLLHRLGSQGFVYTRLAEVDTVGPVDVLIIGSSHAYRGYDTRVFADYGLSAFNLGTSAQTPLLTNLLLKRYLDRLDPKLVIYEVYPNPMSYDGVEAAVMIFANDRIDEHNFSVARRLKDIRAVNTLIYAWFLEVTGRTAAFTEDPYDQKRGDRYIPGGFVERSEVYRPDAPWPESTWVTEAEGWRVLDENLTYLQERGYPYILSYTPLTSQRYAAYTNNGEVDSY